MLLLKENTSNNYLNSINLGIQNNIIFEKCQEKFFITYFMNSPNGYLVEDTLHFFLRTLTSSKKISALEIDIRDENENYNNNNH